MLHNIAALIPPRRDRSAKRVIWHGPIRPTRLAELDDRLSWRGGIYLLVGRLPGQRRLRIQYCGMTEQPFSQRITPAHHAGQMIRGLEVWAGKVVEPTRYGRETLLGIEHLIIHYLQPGLNQKGRQLAPPKAALVFDWYGVDPAARRVVRKMLPDELSFNGVRFAEITFTESERLRRRHYV